MSRDVSGVLAAIDAAVADRSVSADAMRCPPGGEDADTGEGCALVLRPDGRVTPLHLPAEESLAALRDAIGCRLVDCVALAPGIDMWVDDEGLYTEPVNPLATTLARRCGFTHQPYHGTVVLCGVTPGGDTTHLTRAQAAALTREIPTAATS